MYEKVHDLVWIKFNPTESFPVTMTAIKRKCKVPFKLFKAQWLLYVPTSLTLKNSKFCTRNVFVCVLVYLTTKGDVWTIQHYIWCGFDRASSLIRGNKIPTRCNRWIFIADLIACSTCFGAPLCPSSGAREYYTSGCCLSYLVL